MVLLVDSLKQPRPLLGLLPWGSPVPPEVCSCVRALRARLWQPSAASAATRNTAQFPSQYGPQLSNIREQTLLPAAGEQLLQVPDTPPGTGGIHCPDDFSPSSLALSWSPGGVGQLALPAPVRAGRCKSGKHKGIAAPPCERRERADPAATLRPHWMCRGKGEG